MIKRLKRVLISVLTVAMTITMINTINTPTVKAEDPFYRIYHVDAGRKYFSVEQIEDLIDVLAENHYTHMELAIGNDGLRFLLDDMTVNANDTTYASDKVKTGIQDGNKAYYNAGDKNELTQGDMDSIITHAKNQGIEIIPLLNTPGHMDAILDCMESVGISNPAYNRSSRTVDVTNTPAVNFTLALVDKYIQYFKGKGCTFFNIGCDEYANDVGNGFAGLISSGKYGSFVNYVNALADQVKTAGMTPIAFNDGIYYNENTLSGDFDSNIVIAYWTSGWGGYSPASASFLAKKGHKIINTNDNWYYVLGRRTGSYPLTGAQNGVVKVSCTDIPGENDPTAIGCMACLWCDSPSASYDNTEFENVKGLINTLATNNPTYFVSSGSGDTGPVEPENPGDITREETITLTVGDSTTREFDGDITTTINRDDLNESIATVDDDYQKVDGKIEFNPVTDVSSGSYYIKSNDNQYLTASGEWTSEVDQACKWTYYYSKLSNGSSYLKYSNGNWATDSSYFNGTDIYFDDGLFYRTREKIGGSFFNPIYTYKDPLGQPGNIKTEDPVNQTTVIFEGKSVGTTYVTIGNTKYKITVLAEDLNNVTPLTVEYWITNLPVTAGGSTSKNISASAKDVYGENGVDITTLLPSDGTYEYGNVVIWKGTVLDSNNKQTDAGGNDKTASGNDFKLIRYFSGAWQYCNADGQWTTIKDTDQVVIYWLQPTEVTKEITTLVKDWGFSPDAQGDDVNKVALTVAVVYPDGTVSPTEENMYSQSTTLFNYWNDRDIGLVAPVNNSDYTISKITVTDGKRDQSGTGKWGVNDTITWDKVTNEAGSEWYDEETYWTEANGGTPMVNGALSDIIWPEYNTAKLVLIYLEPVHYDTNLIVNWVDDSNNESLISSMEIAVSSDSTPTTFYNGLKQSSTLPVEGVGGTFTLDDNAYVTNKSNINQKFNKDITTIPGVADVYKSGLYKYVSADISADGKTLTLHYNINSDKLSLKYVMDFGLPVNVPLSDLVENSGGVTKVEIPSNNAVYSNGVITFTPSKVMTGVETVNVKLYFGTETPSTFTIGFIPATTVYYEEGFAEYKGDHWATTGSSKGTDSQEAAKPGNLASNYGYDSKYAGEATGPSNESQATSQYPQGVATDYAEFYFTGSGLDIYTNNTTSSGKLFVSIYDTASNTLKKMIQVNTAMKDGVTDSTSGQAVTAYNVPVVSMDLGVRANYKVIISHMKNNNSAEDTISLDGFKVYGTLDYANEAYTLDKEANPTFVELRDQVLSALGVDTTKSQYANQIAKDTFSQVYADKGTTVGAVIISDQNENNGDTAKDLLDNGPKNEIYLRPNESVVFNLNATSGQIGLKALNDEVEYTITGAEGTQTTQTLTSSTDMFYPLSGNGPITITNSEDSAGILAITDIKAFGATANASMFNALTAEDFMPALLSLGFEEEPTAVDATLNINVVDVYGKNVANASLVRTGNEGEVAEFAATDIIGAVNNVMPNGYGIANEGNIANVTVTYGEDGEVNVVVGKIATLTVTYKKMFGRNISTVTLTKVQTDTSSKARFTAEEIRAAAPKGYFATNLFSSNVRYGYSSSRTVIVL